MKFSPRSYSLLLVLIVLIMGTVACSTTQNARPAAKLGAAQGHVPENIAKQPTIGSASAVQPATAAAATSEEHRLAVRPAAAIEKPRTAVPSGPDEPQIEPALGSDEGIPAPGEGWILPNDAVTVGPDNGPAISELDPNIPLNMKMKMPEWGEESEEALMEKYKGFVPMGDDVGPNVDLSDPSTPASSLLPILNTTRTFDPASNGWISYPASNPGGGPPDVSLTVGKDYVVAGYNSYYQIYNKGTGTSAGAFNMTTLFSGVGSICSAGYNICDPQVLYDESNNDALGTTCPPDVAGGHFDPRYILVALAVNSSGEGAICIAVSKKGLAPTNTANFWKYELNPTGTGYPDYPKIAVGPDALIIGGNYFGTGTPMGWAVSKSGLYAGTAPTTREYTFAAGLFTPWPANIVGCKQSQVPTYNGTHLAVMNLTTNALQLYRWPVPSVSNNPAAYGTSVLSATDCTNPSGAYFTNNPIDCMYGQWMDPEQRGDIFYAVHGTSGGAGAALGWAKINVSGASPGTPTSGTISETGNFLWMGSIASDRDYDFGIAFSRASQTNSMYIQGAVAGNEAGVWGATTTSKIGDGIYNNGVYQSPSYRWGDYSGFSPDPEDGCTLWSNTQYSRASSLYIDDGSWIRPFKFSSCSSAPQAFMSSLAYTCYQTVTGSLIDMGGTPTNAVYHSTTGGSYPAVISGGPNNWTVSPVTIAQLGAADGDSVWLSFTGSDLASHNSSSAVVACAVNVCVSSIPALSGGCDNDGYMDRGETLNVFPQFINNETFPLPTGFYADLRVDPAFPDANVTIVKGTAEYDALDIGATGGPVGVPFQVRVTGGTNQRTVHFEIYNIRAINGSWTSTCTTNAKFTEVANANNVMGASFAGFPESFDNATFPPTNWSQVDTSGTAGAWARATATVHASPAGTPHSGAGLAYFNSWTAAAGSATRLQRTVDVDTTAIPMVGASFWMYHDTQYTNVDTVQMQISTDAGASWTNVGVPVERRVAASPGWAQVSLDLSSVLGGKATARIGLNAIGGYGNDIHIDDVNFAQITRVDDTATCSGAPVLTLSSSSYGSGYFLGDTQCNNNGYADAGDFGTMLFYLSNSGNEDAYGVTATLSCPSCPAGVTICKNTATYGDIPYSSGFNYSQPNDGFRVAIPTGLAAATALPWVLTVNATNPYSTTINVPTGSPGQSRSGTYTWIDNGDPYSYSIADYVGTAPTSAGSTDRYGFSTAWTTTGVVSQVTTTGSATNYDIDGNNRVAALTAAKAGGTASMAHTFSTAAVNGTINNYWIFDIGGATDAKISLEWANDGATGTFRNIIAPTTANPNPGIAGTGAGNGDQWSTYGYFSLYWQIYNQTATGYGPAAANAMLSNSNFAMRAKVTSGASSKASTTFWADAFWIDFYTWQNTASSCTGACLGPEAPVISEVRDVNPCALTGVQVYFDPGLGTTSTDLYRNGSPVVTNYTSGATYAPGNTTSYNYTIHAINSTAATNSAPAVAGADRTSTEAYFTCPSGVCGPAASVLLTAPSGQTGYQWHRTGMDPITGATTNTYTATVQDTYWVSYNAGACVGTSPGQLVQISSSGPPAVSYTGAGAAKFTKGAGNTINVTYDAASCSSDKTIILSGNYGAWTGYAGCALSNGGSTGTASFTDATASHWYNIVWTKGTASGFPGWAYNGTSNVAETWTVGTLCGMSTDDQAKQTCP